MGNPTKPNRFAVQFTVMADAFADDHMKTIDVPCKTIRACHKLRLQFYAFREASRKTGEIKDYPILEGVESTIDKETLTVRFQLKDYSDLAMALDSALQTAGVDTGTPPSPKLKNAAKAV